MSKIIMTALAVYCAFTSSAQQLITEFKTKNRQLNFQAITLGDSILFSFDEVVGPNGKRVRDVKWVTETGVSHDVFCPQDIFAIEVEGNRIYHYYLEKKSLRAYERSAQSSTMFGLKETIEFNNEFLVGSYVKENLFVMLLNDRGNELTVQEIAAMKVVNTIIYKLPIRVDHLIKKNTLIEFYDQSPIDSFKGRARVKLFFDVDAIVLLLDERRVEPTQSHPNVTHLFQLKSNGEVKYSRILSGKANFGSFYCDGKVFRNHISKDAFFLTAYDLTGNRLMKHRITYDSIEAFDKDSVKVNLRLGRESFQGWDTFRQTFRSAGMSDPLIVVSKVKDDYTVQWGTYFDDKGIGTYGGVNPLAAMATFMVTTAIKQIGDGPGISRYAYFETDLGERKILYAQGQGGVSLRSKIDEYERSKQNKNKTPFESKTYISFKEGIVAIYRLKPVSQVGITQLVYFQ